MGHKAQMNVKHVGNISALRSHIDAYMRDLPTSHRNPKRFNPARTSNPAVADEWEQRVAALHAKVRITCRAKGKTLPSKFDPAPIAAHDRVGLMLGLTSGVPTYEITHYPDGGVTVWYHPEGTAGQYSAYAHADAYKGFDADKAIPSLKCEAFANYSAMGDI